MTRARRPTVAVWKFASCDGCQLSLLDLEDDLLALAGAIDIAHFPEATSHVRPGPYDLSLVEGSITTPRDRTRILEVRKQSKVLVTIGACATAGGIQALRNFADADAFRAAIYASPGFIDTLDTSTGIADHVRVDYELRGCPVNKLQLLEVVSALVHERPPNVPTHAVCVDCKSAGHVCVLVTGTPCLGPITHAGCGALCPSFSRGCYGCYGPVASPNMASMTAVLGGAGADRLKVGRLLRTFNANAPELRRASTALGLPAPTEAGGVHD